ncbi:hypothetical protein GCM10008018_23230 [Paenibacillus marchantiophytorum]|uniref:Uncharacterized protein n=1 Tax=Paenibacillus marchantiophytorum TaxID=1619310 RepID=A0ABQ1ELC5_9BACL|nr:hypothetical protein GCM10008018_23230 [Paenibacillus marchantiophytorum]
MLMLMIVVVVMVVAMMLMMMVTVAIIMLMHMRAPMSITSIRLDLNRVAKRIAPQEARQKKSNDQGDAKG